VTGSARPLALAWATGIDVLPPDRVVERRDGYLLVRSPGNPAHYWGNLLIFDEPPADGDAGRWEQLFEREFGDDPRVRHRTFAWDRVDGDFGRAREEFAANGYEIDESIGLSAGRDQLQHHPRANRDVTVHALDPAPGADAELWREVLELQVAGRAEGHSEADYRAYAEPWLASRRRRFQSGGGSWFVAIDPATGAVAASCGIVVTASRGRFQSVETLPGYQRRGICSRLVVDAAQHAAGAYGAERFVIVADIGYHALGLYESLGFDRAEHVVGVCRWPRDRA
jgi:ribosomal protein S18 acetylase RimI-like enzyme